MCVVVVGWCACPLCIYLHTCRAPATLLPWLPWHPTGCVFLPALVKCTRCRQRQAKSPQGQTGRSMYIAHPHNPGWLVALPLRASWLVAQVGVDIICTRPRHFQFINRRLCAYARPWLRAPFTWSWRACTAPSEAHELGYGSFSPSAGHCSVVRQMYIMQS